MNNKLSHDELSEISVRAAGRFPYMTFSPGVVSAIIDEYIALSAKPVVTDAELVDKMAAAMQDHLEAHYDEMSVDITEGEVKCWIGCIPEAAKACAALCPPQQTVSEEEAGAMIAELADKLHHAFSLLSAIKQEGKTGVPLGGSFDGYRDVLGRVKSRPVTTPTPDSGETAIGFGEWIHDKCAKTVAIDQ